MSFFRSFAQVLKTGADSSMADKGRGDSRAKSKSPLDKPNGQVKSRPKPSYLRRDKKSKAKGKDQEKAKLAQALEASKLKEANEQAQAKAAEIIKQAENRAREVLIESKSEALKLREKAEKEARDLEDTLSKQQSSLDRQLASLNARLDQIEKREKQLDGRWQALDQQKEDLEAKRQELIDELAVVARMTREQAQAELFARLESDVDRQSAIMIQEKVAKAEEEAERKSQEILIEAMRHGATDYVVEYTISTVPLANAEMKGRIIGKDGRNIRAFERATGVDIELDEGDEVRLTSFDPVRREVARQSLERLLKDGRIQPSRIEEVVERVQKEIDKNLYEEGKRLAHRFSVYDLPNEVIYHLGKFKYRFSYGQNMIHHMIETVQIGRKLAQELGLNVKTVTLGCLLHDIGKVIEGEGTHVQLGVQFLRRHKLPEEVIAPVAQHHEDEPFSSAESVVVHIADAISGARPGARNENREEYVQRLSEMEDIATSYEGVSKAFAIQAGRELRVILNPDKTTDRDLQVVAQKVAQKIQDDMQYPGAVTVNVIRELRASAKAS
jgi:ribonuclease Y